MRIAGVIGGQTRAGGTRATAIGAAALAAVLWLGILSASGRPANAGPQLFEVLVEIKAPSGEDLGRRRITTPLEVEAVIESSDGPTLMKLAVLVKRVSDPNCQQVSLRLERRDPGELVKESSVRAVACGDWPLRFEGVDLGAPSLTVTVKKAGS